MTLWVGIAGMVYLFWGSVSFSQRVDARATVDWPQLDLVVRSGGLDQPIYVTHAGDGSGRLFVVERAGRIQVVEDNTVHTSPFLDITDRVGCCQGEQGLFSVAFPPDYADTGYFYVDYTDTSGDTVVARYAVSADPNVADPASEEVVLSINQPHAYHNDGQLAFGPQDGYLYIATGDGGGSGDPWNNAQDPHSLLGKLLRIDVGAGTISYTIPASNPYTQTTGYRDEIWALGLRNPWHFSFDRNTGDLYIGDVGGSAYEEVNFQPASSAGGENYGWPIMEGMDCYPNTTCDRTGLALPVTQYDHSMGCAITGGFVYRGERYPRMDGIYFYGDWCSGRIWGLQRDGDDWRTELLYDTSLGITSFGEDEAGNLYVADYYGGTIYEIVDHPRPDLSTSSKTVSPRVGYAGTPFTYTITLRNTGQRPLTETVFLTDTFPGGLNYVSDTLTASQGTAEIADDSLLWRGTVNLTSTVKIMYQMMATEMAEGWLTNVVRVDTRRYEDYTLDASVLISPHLINLPLVFSEHHHK